MTDMYHKRFLCTEDYGEGQQWFKAGVIYDFYYTGRAKQWSVKTEAGNVATLSVVMAGIWGDVFKEVPLTVELENK